jgi:hypothetical protein
MVRLLVPGAQSSVSIPEAKVRWVAEQTFGVEFENVRPDELDELEELISEFDETEEGGHA